jgi:hypothetical protein
MRDKLIKIIEVRKVRVVNDLLLVIGHHDEYQKVFLHVRDLHD